MKKRNTFLILFAALLLSCSSDDEIDRPLGNFLEVGDSARDFMTNENFDKLFIEIACVSGFCPQPDTVDNFLTFLAATTDKEDITVAIRPLPSPGQTSLSINEIARLESDNRTAYNQGTTLAVYIYFTDAPSNLDGGNSVVLGAVYRNTSMVIFGSTIGTAAQRSTSASLIDIETGTVNHEFGHLFGLVNLGTPLLSPHEDQDAPGHCDVEGCLMQGTLQLGGCGRRLLEIIEYNASQGNDIVPELDAACIEDLQGNGSPIVSDTP